MLKLNKNLMILGSAQFGMNYGITNNKGKVKCDEALQIIRNAVDRGVEYIDTAAVYGDSEEVIGKALSGNLGENVKIITKLLPFSEKKDDEYCKSFVRKSIFGSLTNLNCKKIDTIMLHRAQHLNNKVIIEELMKLRDKELFKNIGVTVQTPQELELVLKKRYISIIQMPLNILDHRWDMLIYNIKKIKDIRDLKIHARSIFLQGLLIDNRKSIWAKANVKEFSKIEDWIKKMIKEHNRNSIKDLCVSYVNGLNWVDSMVIGVESLEHLNENFLLLNNKPLNETQIESIKKTRPYLNPCTLNPSMWKMS